MLLSHKDHGDGKDIVKGRPESSELRYWENGNVMAGQEDGRDRKGTKASHMLLEFVRLHI